MLCRRTVEVKSRELNCRPMVFVNFARFVQNASLYASLQYGAIRFSIKEGIYEGYSNQKKNLPVNVWQVV